MRYVIGIDLGTTNSCVAYIDTKDPKSSVQIFKIPQIILEGSVDALTTLPSFCYLSADHEWAKGSMTLPWHHPNQPESSYFVGSFAALQGSKTPTRLVQSAKSWLCHSSAARRDKILPLDAVNEASRISPVEATARYLSHIRDAWNEIMAKGDSESDFDMQEIILTTPASFDEVARTLTVEAARLAGYKQLTLLEEPQAAFYSWIAAHEQTWNTILKSGDLILVCDVGGGTTDFTLISVIENQGILSLERQSVGNHLLLGGDNMDAAIAHLIENKLSKKGHEVSILQRSQLHHEARLAKEFLLTTNKTAEGQDIYRVLLQGTGSSVVLNTVSVELNRDEVIDLLMKGFFGSYSWEEALKLNKTLGMRSMGLPYEDEPSVVKQLASFLSKSLNKEQMSPTHILFNGGAMKPKLFQQSILNALHTWFPRCAVQTLPSFHLDLAVARGAAYYGKARLGLGVKIGGGMARGLYLILETKTSLGENERKALCILPKGSQEGDVYEPSHTFKLLPNTPVSFLLATSHVRLHDKSGDLIDINPEEMHLLPSIHTILKFGSQGSLDKIPVHVYTKLTPIGTLEIGLHHLHSDLKWRLEFQVRTASGLDDTIGSTIQPKMDRTFDLNLLKEAEVVISQVFGPSRGDIKPSRLMEELEQVLHLPRLEWPPSVMRFIADAAIKKASFRKVSIEYFARFFNLIGFCLRPGTCYPLDDFRIKELWKILLSVTKTPIPQEVEIQLWICYRRIAAGLSRGQQVQLASDLMNTILKKSGTFEIKGKGDLYTFGERLRALASFELLDTTQKVKIGNAIIKRLIAKEATNAEYWALGRIGSRHLLYGSLINVVGVDICEQWIEKLLTLDSDEKLMRLICQLARKTEYRQINISQNVQLSILKKFKDTPYLDTIEEVLLNDKRLTAIEEEMAFGESLPIGLQLH